MRTRILLGLFLTALLMSAMSCVTAYYKQFGTGGELPNVGNGFDFAKIGFGTSISVNVTKDNRADSVYRISIWTHPIDITNDNDKREYVGVSFLGATIRFKQTVTELQLDQLRTSSAIKVDYHDTYIFEDMVIPNSVDTIVLTVSVSYSNRGGTVLADTTVQFFRFEDSEKLPIG